MIASFVETCKLNGEDPQACFCDVIIRIVGDRPFSRLYEVLRRAYLTIPGLKVTA